MIKVKLECEHQPSELIIFSTGSEGPDLCTDIGITYIYDDEGKDTVGHFVVRTDDSDPFLDLRIIAGALIAIADGKESK